MTSDDSKDSGSSPATDATLPAPRGAATRRLGSTPRARANETVRGTGVAPTASRDPELLPVVGREQYDLGDELARGGMGRILRGSDRRMRRPVAVKELIAPTPAAVARFEREALLTGRLQHPGIVPIYEAGRWADGEPFFAMREVVGRPLDEVIDAAENLGQRIALLPNFIAVAEALAYAHSHRIIHRDLKPANVLLGEYGETVVIDWGLGKELSRRDESLPLPDSAPGDEIDLTVAGTAMGTPSYMPPEQAKGEEVDERADVYALGAALYQLLSGSPPYRDLKPSSAHELLEHVMDTPPTPLGTLEPDAPPDLVAIVDKAMARDPAARYPSAKELAEDLVRFATGQLVSAHEYSVASLLKRWLRRHRAAVIVAASMLLLLVIGAAVSFSRITRERDRAESERASAERSRDEVEDLMGFMLVDLRQRLQPIGKLDLLELVARKADAHYAGRARREEQAQSRHERSIAHSILGDVAKQRGDLDQAIDYYLKALAVGEQLTEKDPSNRTWRRDLFIGHLNVGDALHAKGDQPAALAEYREALAVAKAEAEADPDSIERLVDHSAANERMGVVLHSMGKLDEALEYHRAALAIRSEVIAREPEPPANQRALAVSHEDVGGVLFDQHDLDGAAAEFSAARAIDEQLATADPDDAIRARDLSISTLRLGDVEALRGDVESALRRYRAGLSIAERLVEKDPENAVWLRDLSIVLNKIGAVLAERDQRAEALAHYRRALSIRERLAARDADNATWQRDLAIAYRNVASVSAPRGNGATATGLYRKCAQTLAGIGDQYNAACCHALAGDRDAAFAELQRLLAGGFRDLESLATDPDFAGIRNDPRWKALLAEASER